MNNEEQELRNAAKWLRQARPVVFPEAPEIQAVAVERNVWASMLERAAQRIEQLEAYIEQQGLVA